AWRAALRPCQERLLVRVAALDRGDAAARALPERDRPAGDLGRARRHRMDAGEPRSRHRRGRRNGFPSLPRSAAALSRSGDRLLHRLDAARRPQRAVSGDARHQRPLAVQQRPGELGRSPYALIAGAALATRSDDEGSRKADRNPLSSTGPRAAVEFLPALNFREITTVSRHAMDQPRWG